MGWKEWWCYAWRGGGLRVCWVSMIATSMQPEGTPIASGEGVGIRKEDDDKDWSSSRGSRRPRNEIFHHRSPCTC